MDKEFNKSEWQFFVTALKEEARTILWEVGSNTDPQALIDSVLPELEALAPRGDGKEDRSEEEIWRQVRERLLKAAYATRPHCIRCGTCCKTGSPTLLREDFHLFAKNVLKPGHVVTIRSGEWGYSNKDQHASPVDRELIKIREKPGEKTCIFFENWDKSCSIYESRPRQCVLQECWNPETVEAAPEDPLSRKDLLKAAGPLWEIIQRHEERCSHEELNRAMARLSATKGRTVEEILDLLRFDDHVRQFVSERLGIADDDMVFFFGRPLRDCIEAFGLKVEQQADGSFLLTQVQQAE